MAADWAALAGWLEYISGICSQDKLDDPSSNVRISPIVAIVIVVIALATVSSRLFFIESHSLYSYSCNWLDVCRYVRTYAQQLSEYTCS